jgi:hypothetical protein
MALIDRNPAVRDCFLEISLQDIAGRGGIADLFEEGRLIVLKDYRLDVDFAAIASLSKSTDQVEDQGLRKKLKKLTAPAFFEGDPPNERRGNLIFTDPLRQAVFDILCNGNRDTFARAARALQQAHDALLRLYELCFPNYDSFRLVPSVRLTRTLFENLHWDNHSIDDDFHQTRIFANLDTRPRIWSISYQFTDFVRDHYVEYDLGRFAGKDPNLMIHFITGKILGGTRKTWMDSLPRHRVAFDPGEVWLGESRLLSHQIFYGEAAMVYMWLVNNASMTDPANRFNERVEAVHREMRAKAKAA